MYISVNSLVRNWLRVFHLNIYFIHFFNDKNVYDMSTKELFLSMLWVTQTNAKLSDYSRQ